MRAYADTSALLYGRKAMGSPFLRRGRKELPAAGGTLQREPKPVRLGAAVSCAVDYVRFGQNNPPFNHGLPGREFVAATHTGRSSRLLRIIKCTCLMPGVKNRKGQLTEGKTEPPNRHGRKSSCR